MASDGPRDTHHDEFKKVHKIRDYLINSIDWDCEIKTLFQEKNLGCKYAPKMQLHGFLKMKKAESF